MLRIFQLVCFYHGFFNIVDRHCKKPYANIIFVAITPLLCLTKSKRGAATLHYLISGKPSEEYILRLFKIIVILPIIIATICFTGSTIHPSEQNLAKNARYTFTPEAKYHLTRSPSDSTKLTDGRYAKGHFWTDQSATVGWEDSGPIRIEVDLEGVVEINSICVRTARGMHAEVSYPERIDLFAAYGDGYYKSLGDLLAGKDIDDGEYQVRRFCSPSLETSGTGLVLVVKPRGHYVFIDEVEVLGRRLASYSHEGAKKGLTANDIDAYLSDRYRITTSRRALQVLVKELETSVNDSSITNSGVTRITNRLTQEENRINLNELAELQKQLFATRQPWLAEQHREPLLIWRTNPWEIFSPLSLPTFPLASTKISVEVDLPSGGTSSTALALTNTTLKPITVRVIHESDRASPSVTLREVESVVRQDYRTVGDPLLWLSGNTLTILPGQSKQVWITISAFSMPPGIYSSRIKIVGPSGVIMVPLKSRVWDVFLPRKSSLAVNTWSYLNFRPIRHIQKKAISDLEAHHVNVFVIHPIYIPWPNYNARNEYGSPDYRSFDKVLNLHPVGSKFLIYLGMNDDPTRYKRIAPYPFLSEDWNNGFIRWYSEWVEHLKKNGIHEDDFALYPFDEPRTEQGFITIIEIAKILKKINPRLQIYTTLSILPTINRDVLLNHVDILQVHESLLSNLKPLIRSVRPIQIWSYTAIGGGKDADPHSFYRLQAWRAFQHGATGIGFWAYADTGPSGSAWDDFDGTRPDFAVIYEGENRIISSKRWEAWREGVEDYQLLQQAQRKLKPGPATAEFNRRINRVLAVPNDFRYFEETRRLLLQISSREFRS